MISTKQQSIYETPPKKNQCVNCLYTIDQNAANCQACGVEIVKCFGCFYMIPPKARFCAFCGTPTHHRSKRPAIKLEALFLKSVGNTAQTGTKILLVYKEHKPEWASFPVAPDDDLTVSELANLASLHLQLDPTKYTIWQYKPNGIGRPLHPQLLIPKLIAKWGFWGDLTIKSKSDSTISTHDESTSATSQVDHTLRLCPKLFHLIVLCKLIGEQTIEITVSRDTTVLNAVALVAKEINLRETPELYTLAVIINDEAHSDHNEILTYLKHDDRPLSFMYHHFEQFAIDKSDSRSRKKNQLNWQNLCYILKAKPAKASTTNIITTTDNKVVIRMYLLNGSFKSIPIDAGTTIQDIREYLASKVRSKPAEYFETGHVVVHTPSGPDSHRILTNKDSIFSIHQAWIKNDYDIGPQQCHFTFKAQNDDFISIYFQDNTVFEYCLDINSTAIDVTNHIVKLSQFPDLPKNYRLFQIRGGSSKGKKMSDDEKPLQIKRYFGDSQLNAKGKPADYFLLKHVSVFKKTKTNGRGLARS